MKRSSIFVSTLLAALVGRAFSPLDAEACAPAPPRGEEVRIVGEEALIVWDEASKTETFVRRAGFRSTAKTFGFLVPTPDKPELGVVEASMFDALGWRIRPEVREVTEGTHVSLSSFFLTMFSRSLKSAPDEASATAVAPVRVLQEAKVAGFDATVLEADDPEALAAWLGKNGFDSSSELTEWLTPYVEKKWKMTAFKLDGSLDASASSQALQTGAVRMTFHTDRPFYPYREPRAREGETKLAKSGQAPDSRTLRVFFVSDDKVDGKLGDTPWSAKVLHAARVQDLPAPVEALAGRARFLTVFTDDSFPRRGTDEVFFDNASDPTEVKQPPIIQKRPREIAIPFELGFVVAGVVVLLVSLRRQRARLGA